MSKSVFTFSTAPVFSLATVVLSLTLPGCDRTEKIQSYTVPKHDAIQTKEFLDAQAARHPKPVPRRMVGVIIPRQSSFWFFKLEGDVDAVAARENDVREFLKSVRFPEADNPDQIQWTEPEGWKRLPGTELRYATLVLSGSPRLEMSVSKLPLQRDQEISEQVVANINRWRGQLSLPPIEQSELATESQQVPLKDGAGYWVNLLGTAVPKPGMMPAGHPQVDKPSQRPAESAKSSESQADQALKFEKPSEWEEAPATVFSKVSLLVRDGDKKVAVTVTPSRGNLVDNVNRWRNQLNLEPLAADKLMPTAKKVSVGRLPGDLFELTNGDRSIYGVIVELGEVTWFVKLDGNTALAERERSRFETFLKTLQLN